MHTPDAASMMTPLAVISRFAPHDGTLCGMLATRAERIPDHPFLEFEGARWSYRAFAERVECAAAGLHARGVAAGDRVGVISRNHPATVVALFALARLGAILVPLNRDFGAAEAGYAIDHAGLSGLIVSEDALAVAREACGAVARPPWIALNAPGGDPVSVFDAQAPCVAPPRAAAADAAGLFIYTSGTTGYPKAVMHSQRNLALAGEGFVERMWLQPDERLLAILPLFHINAIAYSLAGALAAGATLILEREFSASRFWTRVADSGATEVNTIAAITSILMRRPRSEFVPGHRLRKIYGAPLTAETIETFRSEFGVPHLIEGYGMSEIPGVLNNPFHGPHKPGSMGKPSRHPDHRIEFARMRVVDERGREQPDGAVGELEVKTPIAMLGYFRDPDQTAAAFRDGWFRTGDLGRRDADGWFWFAARAKDIIRRRGENISGAEIDRVIALHPEVLEAAVIAVPSDLGEDDILAAVVARPGARLNARDIADWVGAHLSSAKVPRYVAFVDELPHTPTHRVAKHRLRNDATLLAQAVDLG